MMLMIILWIMKNIKNGLQQDKITVFDCNIYELDKNQEPEGNLTYVYNNLHVPFDVKRVFYSYDIPGGESRGAHAHKECHQFLIAGSGSFEVVLDDGINKRTILLFIRKYLSCFGEPWL